MTASIHTTLNETLRDALVSLYLAEVAPRQQRLSEKLTSADDVFNYLLLDVQVSQAVETSRVASAISSIQQYINNIVMGMEPGYEMQGLKPGTVRAWKEQFSQYSIWAGHQLLAWYPENYIDPTLRKNKTGHFRQLETDINQTRIEVDTTHKAVNAYLTRFEEVANLTLLSGYVDSYELANGTYYFIGKSPSSDLYYWRSLDMSARGYKARAGGAKLDTPAIGAWTEWKRVDLPFNLTTLRQTIRPVFFNNRLCVTWVNCVQVNGPRNTVSDVMKLSVNMAYKNYDDSWSVPQTYHEVEIDGTSGLNPSALTRLQSVAVYQPDIPLKSIFVGLYAEAGTDAETGHSGFSFLLGITIGRNFEVQVLNVRRTESRARLDERYMAILKVFSDKPGRLQCVVPRTRPEFQVESMPEGVGVILRNRYGLQHRIGELTVRYERGNVVAQSSIEQGIPAGGLQTLQLRAGRSDGVACHLTLKFRPTRDAHPVLLEGSELVIHKLTDLKRSDRFELAFSPYVEGQESGAAHALLLDPVSQRDLTVSPTDGAGATISLQGALINAAVIRDTKHHKAAGRLSVLRNDHSLFSQPAQAVIAHTPLEMTHLISAMPDLNTTDIQILAQSTAKEMFSPQTRLHCEIPVNDMFLPGWSPENAEFYILHGLGVELQAPGGTWRHIGHGARLCRVRVTETLMDAIAPPSITTVVDPVIGAAQYLDFTDSSIALADDGSAPRMPIRMNTLFAKDLVNRANSSFQALLSWSTQLLPEPAIAHLSDNRMDFNGANGLYFWEVFFHLPFLVAHRLNLEQQFDQAEEWIGHIFDPGRKAARYTDGRPDYWNMRPLVRGMTAPGSAGAITGPTDPDAIAASFPVHYQKAVHAFYIKNLIDRGDAAYRQLTPDSLGQAKLWYMRALSLLGKRPDSSLISRWEPMSLGTLISDRNPQLRVFERGMIQRAMVVAHTPSRPGGAMRSPDHRHELRIQPYVADPSLQQLDCPHLRTPMNIKAISQWDTVESRLSNLRANRSLDGKALSLPLFAAPLEPGLQVSAQVQGSGLSSAGSLLAQNTPHYRFPVMLGKASSAVDYLIRFGGLLLSINERKDQSKLTQQQFQQAWGMAQMGLELEAQSRQVEIETRKALEASRAIAQATHDFYADLVANSVLASEITAITFKSAATAAAVASSSLKATGAALKVLPNIFGTSFGGSEPDGPFNSAAAISDVAATLASSSAGLYETKSSNLRRAQQWTFQRDQAAKDVEVADIKLREHDEQALITAQRLRKASSELANAKANYEFLGSRFTSYQLYQWLNGQLAAFYRQTYDTILSLCMAAQACWQYERCDYATRFIQPGAWKDGYRGLTAGESLKLDLLRMDAAYLEQDVRPLEISKRISVKALLSDENLSGRNVRAWDDFIEELHHGVGTLTLTQALFDRDYPGHYRRRIRHVSVSLKSKKSSSADNAEFIDNLCATLTQTYNAVALKADAASVRYLLDASQGSSAEVRENMRANQEIALSRSVEADGLFTLNFGDARYLPFEGTGAVSRWTLQFPALAHGGSVGALRDSFLAGLDDVILNIRYTATNGGPDFAKTVSEVHKLRR